MEEWKKPPRTRYALSSSLLDDSIQGEDKRDVSKPRNSLINPVFEESFIASPRERFVTRMPPSPKQKSRYHLELEESLLNVDCNDYVQSVAESESVELISAQLLESIYKQDSPTFYFSIVLYCTVSILKVNEISVYYRKICDQICAEVGDYVVTENVYDLVQLSNRSDVYHSSLNGELGRMSLDQDYLDSRPSITGPLSTTDYTVKRIADFKCLQLTQTHKHERLRWAR
uniref:Uncharacterized protein n=1 Tax=Heterorhabditis bacteriophora TaxID=37862 RepID=A0A1I7X793_HETBA